MNKTSLLFCHEDNYMIHVMCKPIRTVFVGVPTC